MGDDTRARASSKAPSVRKDKVTLRVLGTSVSLLEVIRKRAESDLGIRLEYIVHDSTTAQQMATLQPGAFDLYDQWFHNIDLTWATRSIQPIELNRIELWEEINDLPKLGRLSPEAPVAKGGNPAHRLYVQTNGELGVDPTARISMLPTVHNADSFAYLLPRSQPEPLSWSALLDDEYMGAIALQSDPAIGALDAALAVQAANLCKFDDLGNLTVDEIDLLVDHLIRLKKAGRFKHFWATEAEAAELLTSGAANISSMWWQGFVRLRRQGVPVRMATPREGYRGWYGGLALSNCLKGRERDAAYEYLNWWLSGFAGAMMARNGAYMSNPQSVREHLELAEWDYWYEGKPATQDLCDPYGEVIVREGESHEGGSYDTRMNRIIIWDSVMDEHNYLVRRWMDVLKK